MSIGKHDSRQDTDGQVMAAIERHPEPRIGEIVIVGLAAPVNGAHEAPAIVVNVWGRDCVNLIVFADEAGGSSRLSSVGHQSLVGAPVEFGQPRPVHWRHLYEDPTVRPISLYAR